jgi:hypothetical protein
MIPAYFASTAVLLAVTTIVFHFFGGIAAAKLKRPLVRPVKSVDLRYRRDAVVGSCV